MSDIPSGLHYIPDIIPADICQNVLQELNDNQWFPVIPNTNSRMVQHYGYYYDYRTKVINNPAPPFLNSLVDLKNILVLVCQHLNIAQAENFDQCIVNKYLPGQGISAHTDFYKYGGVIGCYTLGSGADMVFKKNQETYTVHTEPYILCQGRPEKTIPT